jgi:hypothetical protein
MELFLSNVILRFDLQLPVYPHERPLLDLELAVNRINEEGQLAAAMGSCAGLSASLDTRRSIRPTCSSSSRWRAVGGRASGMCPT